MNEQQQHSKWTIHLMEAIARAIFDDRNLNPGKNTTKALVDEIIKEINLPMTQYAKTVIWAKVKDLHQTLIIEGQALREPKPLRNKTTA